MPFDFEKEFLNDYERITKTFPTLIKQAKERKKHSDPELTIALEVLSVSFSSYIRILKKYENYQLEKFKNIENKLND